MAEQQGEKLVLAAPEIVAASFVSECVRFVVAKVLKKGFLFIAVDFKSGGVQKNCYKEVRL